METKKRLTTLFLEKGKIHIEDPNGDQFEEFSSPSKDPFNREIEKLLRIRNLNLIRQTNYVTYDEFSNLKTEVNEIKNTLKQLQNVISPSEKDAIIDDFVSRITKVEGIQESYSRAENKHFVFSVVVKKFSADVLRKIAQIEISMSRKYSKFSIQVEPVVSYEDVSEGNELVVKK